MIEVLGRAAIETALQTNHRQYLAGDLKLPQDLEHLRDGEIEVGITDYATYQWEKPHYHPLVTEYQFLLRGAAKYVDLDAGEEILVEAGDFFIIRPNTRYLQKSPAGTRILFFKHPGGNDKTLVPLTGEMRRWCEAWENRWEN